jgi:hypothetical protein
MLMQPGKLLHPCSGFPIARTRQGLAGTDFGLGMWLGRDSGSMSISRTSHLLFPYLLQLSVYS